MSPPIKMHYICKTMCLILQYLCYIKKLRPWHIHTAPPIVFDVWKTASANTTEDKSHGNNSIPAFLWCQAALPWSHSQSPMSPSYGTNETCENTDVRSARKCLINQKHNFRYVWLNVFRHLLMTDLQVANTSNRHTFF